jgi:hypothetical protein
MLAPERGYLCDLGPLSRGPQAATMSHRRVSITIAQARSRVMLKSRNLSKETEVVFHTDQVRGVAILGPSFISTVSLSEAIADPPSFCISFSRRGSIMSCFPGRYRWCGCGTALKRPTMCVLFPVVAAQLFPASHNLSTPLAVLPHACHLQAHEHWWFYQLMVEPSIGSCDYSLLCAFVALILPFACSHFSCP